MTTISVQSKRPECEAAVVREFTCPKTRLRCKLWSSWKFFNLHSIQIWQPRPAGPSRGLWQVLRVLWERNLQQGVVRQTHGLWRGHRVVQTSGGGDKIFLIMIMHHYCDRCPDARTSTRKKNNCTFGRLDPSATPWIIYNTNKYIFRDLLSPEFSCVKGFDTRTL